MNHNIIEFTNSALTPPFQSQVHVQGAHAFSRPVSFGCRLFAQSCDIGWFLCAVLTLLQLVPHCLNYLNDLYVFNDFVFIGILLGILLGILFGLFAIYRYLLRLILGKTLGEMAWGIYRTKFPPRTQNKNSAFSHYPRLTNFQLTRGIVLTFFPVLCCFEYLIHLENSHPILMTAKTKEFSFKDPSLLVQNSLSETETYKWALLPFFYSVGAWPTLYDSKPVFYTLPYESGPPHRFIGHIVARWKMPETFVTFEGPKTPNPPIPLQEIKNCIVSENALEKFSCLSIRNKTLSRHLLEMLEDSGKTTKKFEPTWKPLWQISWLETDQMRGILLQLESEERIQNRMILITRQGQLQTIGFKAPNHVEGKKDEEVFFQALQTLIVNDDQSTGKASIVQSLLGVKHQALERESGSADYANYSIYISKVQSLLMSRISVDPKTFDTFFQLGGTAFQLFRELKKRGGLSDSDEGTANTQALLQSAYRYAKDINPSDPKIDQLQNFWAESRR